MPSVFVAGSINVDLVAVTAALPRPGETVRGQSFAQHFGGKGANQAIASAKLEVPTSLVGKVGKDAFGDELCAFLRQLGVDTTRVGACAAATGVALIVVERSGENCIVVVPGANDQLEPADVADLPMNARDVALTQLETPSATVERFLERARACGATAILNPAPAHPEHAALLELADIVLVNETELALLAATPAVPSSSTAALSAAAQLRRRREQIVVVTLGARGAVALVGDEHIELGGHRVDAVDTTGAGDTFAGALAASLASGSGLARALELANAAAALSVQRPGAAVSSPTLRELRDFVGS